MNCLIEVLSGRKFRGRWLYGRWEVEPVTSWGKMSIKMCFYCVKRGFNSAGRKCSSAQRKSSCNGSKMGSLSFSHSRLCVGKWNHMTFSVYKYSCPWFTKAHRHVSSPLSVRHPGEIPLRCSFQLSGISGEDKNGKDFTFFI